MADDPGELFERLGLSEYEEAALEELLTLGRTTAPNLSEATGIPKARIYGVLESLSDRGFVEIIPGRPKEYQPKSPEDILDRAVENRRQEFEQFHQTVDGMREAFLAEYRPRYERASEDIRPAEELFHVVDVGDPSERETRRLYREADERVHVVTKSFEYFEAVEPAFADAVDRGVEVSVLFLHPDQLSAENRERQPELVETILGSYPSVDARFSTDQLPFRGTITDPSREYDTGTAILLVEEEEVPNHMRQAAITSNGAFVAGLERYFELIWEYESVNRGDIDYSR